MPERTPAAAPQAPARRARVATWPAWPTVLTFGFVLACLGALVLVPIWTDRRTEALRAEIDTVVDPAHPLATRLEFAIAREVASIRGYLLTGRPYYLERYRAARELERRTFAGLERLARDMEPATRGQLDAVAALSRRWHLRNDALVRGETTAAQFLAQVAGQQQVYEALLDRVLALDAALVAETEARRARINEIERFNRRVSLALAAAAFLAALAVGWIVWRERRAAKKAARLLEAALAADRAKTDFLAVMSHELRTPLTAVIGYADLLEMQVAGPLTEAQRTQLGRIRSSARHLLSLIEEVLVFARTDTGREKVVLKRADPAAIARTAAEAVRPAAAEKALRLELDLPAHASTVTTDPSMVRRILVNLLSNAVKFTRTGRVSLQMRLEPDALVYQVRDTGIGIRAEDREKVFDPFWQAEAALTREYGGTGLGLAVARRLTYMLRGEITVESEPGRGSTFTVRLPGDSASAHGGAPPG